MYEEFIPSNAGEARRNITAERTGYLKHMKDEYDLKKKKDYCDHLNEQSLRLHGDFKAAGNFDAGLKIDEFGMPKRIPKIQRQQLDPNFAANAPPLT